MINEEGGDSGQGIAGSLIAVEDAPSLDSAYELGKTIGRGEFAKVKVARCRKSKRLVGIAAMPMGKRQHWHGSMGSDRSGASPGCHQNCSHRL